MKKNRCFVYCVILLTLVFNLQAQNKKGNFFVDGNVGFKKTKEDINPINSAGFPTTTAPFIEEIQIVKSKFSFNYFISDNLSIGPVVGVHSNKIEQNRQFATSGPSGFTQITTTINQDFLEKAVLYNIGLKGSYFMSITEKLKFLPSLNLLFNKGENIIEQNSNSVQSGQFGSPVSSSFLTKTKINGVSVFVTPTITYFLSDHIGLSLSIGELGYKKVKSSNVIDSNYSEFNFDLDLANLQLGFQYYFIRNLHKK